jgi:hypothetical protein
MNTITENLMSVKQFADHKKISRAMIYYYIKKRYIKTTNIGGRIFIEKNSNVVKQLA